MCAWKQTILNNVVDLEKMLRLQKIRKTRWWSKDVFLQRVFDALLTPVQNKQRYIFSIKLLDF